MKPIQFPGVNVVYAEDQPEYLPLPVLRFPITGRVIHCWEPDEQELRQIIKSRKIYFSQETGNDPLQPVMCASVAAQLFHPGLLPIFPSELQVGNKLLWTGKDNEGNPTYGTGIVFDKIGDRFTVRFEKQTWEYYFSALREYWEPVDSLCTCKLVALVVE